MKVYIIAESKIAEGIEAFLSDRGSHWKKDTGVDASAELVEFCSRICYMSFGTRQRQVGNKGCVNNLIERGHNSVLEHASFSVLIDGISRNLSHQLVRHRIGFSYSQLSQQYFDETPVRWTTPTELSLFPETKDEWHRIVEEAETTYRMLLTCTSTTTAGKGLPQFERDRLRRSFARSILPGAASTTIVITGNVRAWRRFFRTRGGIAGDLEMREYCVKVFEAINKRASNLFYDFEIVNDSLGPMVRPKGP